MIPQTAQMQRDGVPTSQAAVLWKGFPGLQWKSCPEASWTSEVKVFTLSLSPSHNHKAAGVACKPRSRQPGPEIWWMVLVGATACPLHTLSPLGITSTPARSPHLQGRSRAACPEMCRLNKSRTRLTSWKNVPSVYLFRSCCHFSPEPAE